MRANYRIKQSKLVAAVGSAIAIGLGIGLAHAGGPIFSGPGTAAIEISDGVHSIICQDNDPCDGNNNTGVILFSQGLDGWFVNVDTGVSKNVLGSANSPEMDLSYNVVYNPLAQVPGDGTLTISFTDTGFLPTPAGFFGSIGGTFGNEVTNVSFADFAGPSDGQFDLTDSICTQSFSKSPYGGACNGKYTGTSPYSLTETITITDTDRTKGQSSGDHSLVEAPEPGTLLLMGVALAGLGFVSRRRGGQA
jgi:hypothetical protein